jgi:hypothetical protein
MVVLEFHQALLEVPLLEPVVAVVELIGAQLAQLWVLDRLAEVMVVQLMALT